MYVRRFEQVTNYDHGRLQSNLVFKSVSGKLEDVNVGSVVPAAVTPKTAWFFRLLHWHGGDVVNVNSTVNIHRN